MPEFIARGRQLTQLADALEAPGSQVVIHGMPGVGKTALARHYAASYGDRYSGGIWWLEANEGFDAMARRAIAELEDHLQNFVSGEGLELGRRLRRCWQFWPGEDDDPVLLVVDNLPSGLEGQDLLKRFTTGLPPRFRQLITQRSEPLTIDAEIDLPVLSSNDALELLKVRAGETGRQRIEQEPDEAQQLVADVEGLPLALVLLGGRLRRVPTLSVKGLRQDLARPDLGAEAFSQTHAELLAEKGLITALLSSWKTLSADGKDLARLLSLTLAGPIPWELVDRCSLIGLESGLGQEWHNALADLVGANLLDIQDATRGLYYLHPLVRQFCVIQRQGWAQEGAWRERLSRAARDLAQERDSVDVIASVDYWRQAAVADPSEASARFGLGYGLIRLGDLNSAKEAFQQSKQNAEAAQDPRAISIAFNGIGDVLVSQGDGAGALAAYQAGLTIAEGLVKRDPANTQWQRDLSVSHDRIGDVLVSQGDGAGALAAYQAGLTIREALAKRDPANTQWQVDVAVSCAKLGSLPTLLSQSSREKFLCRGKDILLALKSSGRLQASQDWTGWFDQTLQQLEQQ